MCCRLVGHRQGEKVDADRGAVAALLRNPERELVTARWDLLHTDTACRWPWSLLFRIRGRGRIPIAVGHGDSGGRVALLRVAALAHEPRAASEESACTFEKGDARVHARGLRSVAERGTGTVERTTRVL